MICCDYFLTFTLITLFLYVDYLYAFLISLPHFYRLYIVATLTYFTFLMYFVLFVLFYSVKALINGSILLQCSTAGHAPRMVWPAYKGINAPSQLPGIGVATLASLYREGQRSMIEAWIAILATTRI